MNNQFKNPTFGGFKPDAMQRIAGTLGYTGDMSGFNSYLEQNPDKKNQMEQFKQAAMMMAKGGVVRNFQTGGTPNYMGTDFKNISPEEAGFKAPTGMATQGYEFYYNPTTKQKVTVGSGGYDVPEGFIKGSSSGYQNTNQQYSPQYNKNNLSSNTNMQNIMNQFNQSQGQGGSDISTLKPDFSRDVIRGGPAMPPPLQTDKPLETPKYVPYGRPPTNTPQQSQTVQQNAAGTFDIVDATGKVIKTNIDTAEQAQQMSGQQQPYAPFDIPMTPMPVPDLGDYDPAKGMPEPLPEPDFSTGYVLPDYAEGQLKDVVTGGTDLSNITLEGNTVKFADGKTIQARTPEQAQMIVNAATKYKTEVQDPHKLKEDAYRNYITSGVTSGVTGDIENIEQEFNTARSNYTQLELELQRLSSQAAANPDDPYLKELVEAKGKEFSDAKVRLDQLAPLYQSAQKTIKDVMTERATDPSLPEGAKMQATLIGAPMQEELIKSTSGQVGTGAGEFGVSSVAQADTYLAQNVEQPNTAKYEADVRADQVAAQTQALNAAQTNEDDARAQVAAATATASMVGDLEAAQGTAHQMTNDVQRELDAGELVDGASTDATKAAKFTEQIDAATATPSEKATVQGQLVGLMEQFDGTTPPAWAAGAIRLANQQMAARGLSASSMAGQAVVQAAMESALPIAQADAQTQASFEAQNLSNRQARAMLAAEQRAQFLGQEFDQDFQSRVLRASKVSDVLNMNFTADQQIQLENSRMMQTMNLENLSNRQGMVLAEASALANLDMGNLNNRQQTAVQNAQNFLQMDLANLSNEQQVEMFKSQQIIQSMLTDQAAVNASRQFNAQSENQANQFYDNLNSTINMYNSEQSNAQSRFNAGQVNEMAKFNAEMKNQREQFNAQNQLVVDQSNAQWRREIATADTAAINRANELNAINTLDISNTAYNNMWQLYGDQMEWAWTSAENQQDRLNELAQEQLTLEGKKMEVDAASSSAFGSLVSSLLFTDMSTLGKTFGGSLLGF